MMGALVDNGKKSTFLRINDFIIMFVIGFIFNHHNRRSSYLLILVHPSMMATPSNVLQESGDLVVAPQSKTVTEEIIEIIISSPPSFSELTPPTPPTPHVTPDPQFQARMQSVDKFDSNSNSNSNPFEDISAIKHSGRTWPKWVNQCHLALITLFFIAAITISIVVAILPFTRNTDWWTQGKDMKARTGFRTIVLFLHAVIDGIIFGYPYFFWYKSFVENKLKLSDSRCDFDDLPMTRLSILNWHQPTAQKKFYYSYTIDHGPGKQVATLGVSISNILFALIVLFRYQSLLPDVVRQIYAADGNEKHIDPELTAVPVDYVAAFVTLMLGLATRVAASGVPTFTVKKFPKLHYFFTGMMFILFGAYMITEVFYMDADRCKIFKNAKHSIVSLAFAAMARRICLLCYWFSFLGIFLFSSFELNGLSSLCELLGLFFQEIYIFSYVVSFRRFDSHSPMVVF